MPAKPLPISVIIITLNEERNLGNALKSIVDVVEEVYVVDSGSSDRTIDVALEYGVKIVQREFTNFGDHWNWALNSLPITTPWTMKMDADEEFSQSLIDELTRIFTEGPKHQGYTVRWRLWFMGKPLHAISDITRLWQTGKCQFSDVTINEHPLVDGLTGRLNGILEHHDSADLHAWLEKQNRYTSMEALARFNQEVLSDEPALFGSSLQRRMFFKKHFLKMPFRFQIWFCYWYFFRGAWKDGSVGAAWARLRVVATRLKYLKIQEMEIKQEPLQISKSRHQFKLDPRVSESEVHQIAHARHEAALPEA